MRTTLAVAVVASLVVGCGSAASEPGASAAPETALRISFWSEGKGTRDSVPQVWTLRCDPAGGTHPTSAGACRRLGRLVRPFAPVPADSQCTELYGGPQQAVVSGLFRGRGMRAELSLTDGCQIARFTRLAFLVPGFRPGS